MTTVSIHSVAIVPSMSHSSASADRSRRRPAVCQSPTPTLGVAGRPPHPQRYPNRAVATMGTGAASDEAMLVREGGRCRAGRHVELGEDVAHVAVDRPLADPESLGDL